MADQKVSLEIIDEFLAQRRIAVVGISRERKAFSVTLFEELCRRGYDVVPVNPKAPELMGRRCFARVQDIQPPVQAALLMTSPEVTDAVVKDCAEAGIRRVWMYRAGGKGAVSRRAVQFCQEQGIEVVPGQCPFMFGPTPEPATVFMVSSVRLAAVIPGVLGLEAECEPCDTEAMRGLAVNFVNCYEDSNRARAYATLEFANTDYLAYRDLPAILAEHVTGTRALDFGCGTGRSTRFLQKLGFDVTAVDISEDMLRIARDLNPSGDYRLVPDDDLTELPVGTFDLALSAFTFDNIPGTSKARLFRDLRKLLTPRGTIVSLVSSPEIYTHNWASFTTKDFPVNSAARSGDVVRIVVTDHQDGRPVEDILCTDESYREIYREAGLEAIQMFRPLAKGDEPYPWVNETKIAPWVIYVLKMS